MHPNGCKSLLFLRVDKIVSLFLFSIRVILQHLESYEKTVEVTYAQSTAIASLVATAGQRSVSQSVKHNCSLNSTNNCECPNDKKYLAAFRMFVRVTVYSVRNVYVTWGGAAWLCWASLMPVNVSQRLGQVSSSATVKYYNGDHKCVAMHWTVCMLLIVFFIVRVCVCVS